MGQCDGGLTDFEAAAKAGDAAAPYDLELSYSTGRNGAPRDYLVAHKWFNLVALRGYEPARVERTEMA